jgi:hypothetical protein
MTRWTGELAEYMMRSRQRQAGDNTFTDEEKKLVQAEVAEEWLRGLQSYTFRWVERHLHRYVTFQVARELRGPYSEAQRRP